MMPGITKIVVAGHLWRALNEHNRFGLVQVGLPAWAASAERAQFL
jgi:hypothetical protein